jgi:hypothetical protein
MEDDIQIFVRLLLNWIDVSLVCWYSRISGVVVSTACHWVCTKHHACTTNSLLNNDIICVVQGVSLAANQTLASTHFVKPQYFQKISIGNYSEPH